MLILTCTLGALAAGGAAGYLLGRRKVAEADRMVDRLEFQLDECRRQNERTLADRERYQRESMLAMQSKFDETVARMKAELESATAEMLRQRESEFARSSSESVSRILEPLNINIEQMRRAVSENTIRHSEIGGQLSDNIRMVMEHSDAARKSADQLADALRGGGRIQGDWGETVLTELLESQGLTEGVHFDTQVVMRDSDSLMRPDVILHLDNERDVIIDAKVSLSAFLDYSNAETDERRAAALAAHVRSIENHVRELVRKDYSSYVKAPRTRLGYVIMFVPCTAAVYAATSQKPDLWRRAMEQGVYIADEQTLYAALRIVDMTWRQITQARNHEQVYALAGEMLDRVDAFMKCFTDIDTKLKAACSSYEQALGKLRDSGQSIPKTCRKLIDLGAKGKRQSTSLSRELSESPDN